MVMSIVLGTTCDPSAIGAAPGRTKSASGSQRAIAFIESPQSGPATVEPNARPALTPPTVWKFSVIGVPRLLAPATIATVANEGV